MLYSPNCSRNAVLFLLTEKLELFLQQTHVLPSKCLELSLLSFFLVELLTDPSNHLLQLLGLQTALKYIDPTYVTSPCILKLVNQSAISSFDSSYPANATLLAQQQSTLAAIIKADQQPSNNTRFIEFDATSDPGPLKVRDILLLRLALSILPSEAS